MKQIRFRRESVDLGSIIKYILVSNLWKQKTCI